MTGIRRLSATDQIREWLSAKADEPEFVNPFPGQQLFSVTFGKDYGKLTENRWETAHLTAANCVGSPVKGGDRMHKPVLDIDMPVKVLESSTPGHHHLFIDKAMTWEDYELLLRTLAAVGIIEPGYLESSLTRKHTAVRLPWIQKEPKLADPDAKAAAA